MDCTPSSAAPREAKASALKCWWLRTADGSGTSSAGLPHAASSKQVDAPARATTTSADANADAMSVSKAWTRAGISAFAYAAATSASSFAPVWWIT